MSVLERLRRVAMEIVDEEESRVTQYTDISLTAVYTIKPYDVADGGVFDLEDESCADLRQAIHSGISLMAQKIGKHGWDTFLSNVFLSLNDKMSKKFNWSKNTMNRETLALVNAEWLDGNEDKVMITFNTNLNTYITDDLAEKFVKDAKASFKSYSRGSSNQITETIRDELEKAGLNGIDVKVKMDHVESVNLTSSNGDQTVTAQWPSKRMRMRTAHLRPGKRPGCVKRVEESIREHRAEITNFIDGLDLPGNASAADVADAIVAMVEEGADFGDLPKEIHDDVVHAYMTAKLGSRRNDEWT